MSAQCTGQRGSLKLRLRMPPPSNINLTPVSTPPAVRCPLPTTSAALSRSAPAYIPGDFSPSWPHNPQDTNLLRAGYQPGWNPKDTPTPIPSTLKSGRLAPPPGMAEPRARAARHKGQMNFSSELRLLLLAYGDPRPHPSFSAEPLPETVRVLDEIVTDFILELCHGAAQVAHHARRQKIKVDDFRFALRRDPNKLGRVQELLRMERELKEARKAFDQNDDQVAKDAGKKGAAPDADADAGNEALPAATGKKGKGKGKRAATRRGSDATEESVPKKRKTLG
ncbi:TFIID-18kDa-domain-containing protein [Penicillium longicatenatum]|uniref:TFIID-18kDa-domain-containing protein n=1 Tax=Penicillium longicatenatum TaxID=1561947 RepID=UPI00254789C6|nr:TFIID-18kDa-domain-containing protein [Penicillium longicatenatum]KAJ5660809.1 TFIID-18kDa-domain-containing protein [Penicillium longicatenatum]